MFFCQSIENVVIFLTVSIHVIFGYNSQSLQWSALVL